ncbi:MAG: phage integrase SAM-like domain-containing protein [Flavobacteriales bacterium]
MKDKHIVLYYTRHNTTMRLSTGVKIQSPKDWNKDREELASHVENRKEKMKVIQKWRQRADSIINEALEDGYEIAGKDLEKRLKNYREEVATRRTSSLRELYEVFLKEKEEVLTQSPDKTPQSVKDYRSLAHALSDFEKDKNRSFLMDEVDTRWLNQFHKWLSEERPKGEGYKTQGALNQKTIKKRFDSFKTFFRWLQQNEYIQNISSITNYKVQVGKTLIDTLTVDEVEAFYQTEFERSSLRKIRDLFVFACHTGLRWSDIIRVRKVHIKEENGYYILSKIAHKTRNTTNEYFQVPLTNTALEIFKRYNYNLDFFSQQKANDYLKEAMYYSGLFNDEMEKQKKTAQYH